MSALRINHVQLAMPAGCEQAARRFYGEVLGLRELEKPPELAARGGVWFALADAQLHLGVDPQFRPAQKAHLALEAGGFDELAARCQAAGHAPRPDGRIPGRRRFYVDDPFGNRLEVMETGAAAGEPERP